MYRPILPMLVLPMLAGFLTLACGTARAESCLNNLPPSNPDMVYRNNGDGTVTDLRSDLMWKKCVEGESGADCGGNATGMLWTAALTAAQASTFAGYSDWRLPNLRELQSLVEDCRRGPAINDGYFPTGLSMVFWSASPTAFGSNYAWAVNFYYGFVNYGNRASSNYNVRLVRGGQSFVD